MCHVGIKLVTKAISVSAHFFDELPITYYYF